MKKHLSLLILFACIGSLVVCGKKGPIFPPVRKIPKPVDDVKIIQRGEAVLIDSTLPDSYADGDLLSGLSVVEIWLMERDPLTEAPFTSTEDFQKSGVLVESVDRDRFSDFIRDTEGTSRRFGYTYVLAKDQFTKELTFGIRVKDDRRRFSNYSGRHPIYPKILPQPPQNLKGKLLKDRIEIEWSPPESNIDSSTPSSEAGYNIYRAEEETDDTGMDRIPTFLRLNTTLLKEPKFTDRNFLFDRSYSYVVRASQTEVEPFLESADSERLTILAEDTFPPATPKGLVSIAGEDLIGLSWDMITEKDLRGYRVYRKAPGDKDFRLLTPDPILENTYTDTAVEKDRIYEYAISALDESGNESPKSKSVSDRIKS